MTFRLAVAGATASTVLLAGCGSGGYFMVTEPGSATPYYTTDISTSGSALQKVQERENRRRRHAAKLGSEENFQGRIHEGNDRAPAPASAALIAARFRPQLSAPSRRPPPRCRLVPAPRPRLLSQRRLRRQNRNSVSYRLIGPWSHRFGAGAPVPMGGCGTGPGSYGDPYPPGIGGCDCRAHAGTGSSAGAARPACGRRLALRPVSLPFCTVGERHVERSSGFQRHAHRDGHPGKSEVHRDGRVRHAQRPLGRLHRCGLSPSGRSEQRSRDFTIGGARPGGHHRRSRMGSEGFGLDARRPVPRGRPTRGSRSMRSPARAGSTCARRRHWSIRVTSG